MPGVESTTGGLGVSALREALGRTGLILPITLRLYVYLHGKHTNTPLI